MYYLVLGIVTLALVALCAYTFIDKNKAKELIDLLQHQLGELEKQLNKAKEEKNLVTIQLDDIRTKYNQSFERIDALNREKEDLVRQNAQCSKERSRLVTKVKDLECIAREKCKDVKEEVKVEMVKEDNPVKTKRPYKKREKKQD